MIMPVFDIGFYMNVILAMLNGENAKIVEKCGKVCGTVLAVLWTIVVNILYLHMYGLFTWISVVMGIQAAMNYSINLVTSLVRGDFNFMEWYQTGYAKAHVMPYAYLGIKI